MQPICSAAQVLLDYPAHEKFVFLFNRVQLLLFVLRKYLPGGARQAGRQTEMRADVWTAQRRRWPKQNGHFHT